MNSQTVVNDVNVVTFVESILPDLPTVNDDDESCEVQPGAVMLETMEGDGGLVDAAQGKCIVMASVREDTSKVYSDIINHGSQFSSATIVGGVENLQSDVGVATIHVPIIGLEEHVGGMGMSYDSSVPMTLEVPVETVMSDSEVQSISYEDYTVANVSGTSSTINDQQPLVITAADGHGNCFVTMSKEEVVTSTPLISPVISKPQVVQPTVPRRAAPRLRIVPNLTRYGRCRLISDQQKTIPATEFKQQLRCTSDIVGKLQLAPKTKKMMQFLSLKGVSKLFSSSGHDISKEHNRLFARHFTARQVEDEEKIEDMILLPLGYQREVDPTKIKRITRRRRYPEAEEYQRRQIQAQMQQNFNNLVAESQKNMETVFLENTGTLDDKGNLQILVQAAECDGTQTEETRGEDSAQILSMYPRADNPVIVLHDGSESSRATAYAQQNIELLLAAAAESGLNRENIHQVIICQQGSGTEPFNSSIIIVPNDATEAITESIITQQAQFVDVSLNNFPISEYVNK